MKTIISLDPVLNVYISKPNEGINEFNDFIIS